LLLDEPTNHLDLETIDSLAAAINAFEGIVTLPLLLLQVVAMATRVRLFSVVRACLGVLVPPLILLFLISVPNFVFLGGLVLVSHDFRLIGQVCEEIWECKDGRVKKWDGDIISYKNKLREQVMAENEF
jgi:hypothetical protein